MKFVKFCDTLTPYDQEAHDWLRNAEEEDTLELKSAGRTNPQNNALHLYCRRLADALNDAGFDQRAFPFKEGLEIPFTQEAVKSLFWAPIQEALIGTASTRALKSKEVNQVYEAVDKAISTRTGVSVEFPHGN